MKISTTLFAIASLIWFGSTGVSNQQNNSTLSSPAIQAKVQQLAIAETNFNGTSVRYYKLADGSINAVLPVVDVHP